MAKAPPKSALGRHRQLAPSASVRVSPLCLGTMTFGDVHNEKYGICSKETSFAILDHFYDNGGQFIDTANAYRDGQSEEWLGEWMKSRGNRDEIVLASKYTSNYQGHENSKIQSNYSGNNIKSMKLSLEASLKKLQTNYLDIFYVHWWDYSTSTPELMQGLNDLVRLGKVFYLGMSDTPAWVVAKANQYARDHGMAQFVVYQGEYNASMRDLERDIIPMCRDEGMALALYGSLNQGRFQTKAEFERREKEGYKGGRNFIPLSEHDKQVSLALERIADRKGATLLNLALAYVLQKAPYMFPIVGGRTVDHLAGNIAALDITITEQEMQEIDDCYVFDPGFPHTFLSGTMFDRSKPKGASKPADVMHSKLAGTFDWVEASRSIKPDQNST
jgi:aryl-alcohol dehydrogenase-like predicted oxidoreductase